MSIEETVQAPGKTALAEDNLKKVIGLGGAISISAGQIIGAGIIALTGIGIGMTGGSVVFAFILAAVVTIIASFPAAYMGATLPTTGGYYRYTSRFISPRFGFFYLMLFFIGQITLAMYALSFAEYFVSVIPGVPIKLIAFLFVTAMYLINLFGVKSAAKLQTAMMVILLLALALFAINGLPRVNYDTFKGATLFTGGYRGFFTASALLTFACGGAVVIAEVGGEMKNPGRDIPIAIIVSTIVVGALYAFISVVAVGVLPLEETAFQPLSNVAKAILPTPLFYFFIIGGAMCALATTLNAVFTWLPKALLISCQDGWLPKKMGVVNKKYGTPHVILTIIYLIGVIPVVTGLSLKFISQLGTAAIQIANILPILSALFLVKRYPEAHKNSSFKLSVPVLATVVIVSIILQIIQGYFLLSDLPKTALFAAGGYIVLAAVYTIWRSKKTEISRDF